MRGTRRNSKQSAASREPFWCPDARERIRTFLPELAVSIVFTTCASTVMGFSNGSDVLALLLAAACVQLVVQPFLYACTYLVNNVALASMGWFLVAFITPVIGPAMDLSGLLGGGGSRFYGALAAMTGASLFYLTRARAALVFIALETLVLLTPAAEINNMAPVTLVGFAAFAALYIMRSSATRITIYYQTDRDSTPGDDVTHSSLSSMGIYGQVAMLGAAIGALCLALSLAGTPLVAHRAFEGSSTSSPTDVPPVQETSTDEKVIKGDSDPVTEPRQIDAQQTEAEQPGASSTAEGKGSPAVGPIIAALLFAALVLPFPVRLLLRKRARRSLEREPRPADRAARIYLAVLSRLEAVGITRGETETPQEFLKEHGDELTGFVTPAELGAEAWASITDIYEMARYGGVDPSDNALATCWQIYDVMPLCARTNLGWISYLIGPFWKM